MLSCRSEPKGQSLPYSLRNWASIPRDLGRSPGSLGPAPV
jgi:hypothetical protein